ncbi:hypothetical protein [Bacillus pumilus]|uniref:hypothetical protein n=1 Tax=Bacillus pumilus TaxID=1408 RepID=UPI0021B5B05C|nr:hypothetical protein [Bacillus pumilus]
MVISMIVLHERLTLISALGTVLTLGGLLLSDKKVRGGRRRNPRCFCRINRRFDQKSAFIH